MTADRVYAALLRLYPKPFRDEYGDEMLVAFREMRRARRSSELRFWLLVVFDTAGAAALEWLDGARWLATAMFGLLATVATAHAVTFTYRYFYHPFFEGTSIPVVWYGVALGFVLGLSVALAQWLLFPPHERRASRWALASAVALPTAILFCGSAVEHAIDGMNPVAAVSHPVALDVLVLALGRPIGWSDLATEFSAMAVSALIVRAFALKPLERSHVH